MRLNSRLISVAIVSSLAFFSVANTATAADPMIDQRAALSKIDQDYKAKTRALRAERSRAIKAAGDKAAADASAAGKDPLTARRAAESEVKASYKPKMDAMAKEFKDARSGVKSQYSRSVKEEVRSMPSAKP
jgi:hypothetical protein